MALLHEAKEKKEKEAAEKEKRKNARMKVSKPFRGDNFFFPVIVFHTQDRYSFSFNKLRICAHSAGKFAQSR